MNPFLEKKTFADIDDVVNNNWTLMLLPVFVMMMVM